MRYFIRLSYLGTPFHGWQVQPNAVSVQELLNEALSTVTGEDIYVVGAGRTDTGVHAREMWAHFDAEKELMADLKYKLNKFIGPDIAIRKIVPVIAEAHARFDAVLRQYQYWITRQKDPFLKDRAYFYYGELDVEKMQQASEILLGTKDFSCFSKSNTQTKTNICHIVKAMWQEQNNLLIFTVEADRFLRNMVRAIVGTLLEIGQGKRKIVEITELLDAKDRKRSGESVPAHGLYLTRVDYPKEIFDV